MRWPGKYPELTPLWPTLEDPAEGLVDCRLRTGALPVIGPYPAMESDSASGSRPALKQGSAMGRQLDAAVYQPLLLPRTRQNLRTTAATTFAVRWTFQQGPQTFLPTASTFPLAVQSKFLA